MGVSAHFYGLSKTMTCMASGEFLEDLTKDDFDLKDSRYYEQDGYKDIEDWEINIITVLDNSRSHGFEQLIESHNIDLIKNYNNNDILISHDEIVKLYKILIDLKYIEMDSDPELDVDDYIYIINRLSCIVDSNNPHDMYYIYFSGNRDRGEDNE